MFFQVMIVNLHCEDCEQKQEHVVCFIGFSVKTHKIKIRYYCQRCFDTSAEFGTNYTEWERWINAKEYFELQKMNENPPAN